MFAKIKNGEVVKFPYEWEDFVSDNNNTYYGLDRDMFSIFPKTDVAKQGYSCVSVEVLPQPSFDQKIQRIEANQMPSIVDGKWSIGWTVVDKTAQEFNVDKYEIAKTVRAERNLRLSKCDWTQLPDTVVDKSVWATYRQQLREISTQPNFPWEVTWPEEPVSP